MSTASEATNRDRDRAAVRGGETGQASLPSDSSVAGFVAWLPLDAAAHRGYLIGRDRRAGQHRVDGGANVGRGHRQVVARPGSVELTAVHQSALAVEDERVRRASSNSASRRAPMGVRLTVLRRRCETRRSMSLFGLQILEQADEVGGVS